MKNMLVYGVKPRRRQEKKHLTKYPRTKKEFDRMLEKKLFTCIALFNMGHPLYDTVVSES